MIDLVLYVQRDGTVLDLPVPDLLGAEVSPASARGHRVNELLPAALAQALMAAITQAAGQARRGFATVELVDREPARHLEVWASPAARADNGGPACFVVISADTTERRRAEQALRTNEQRYRLLAENASDVIWTMSLDGRITSLSASVEKVRGFTVEEAMTQTLDQILAPPSQGEVIRYFEALHRALAEGRTPEPYRGEQQYLRKDGSIFWADVIACPVTDSEGRVVEILGVSRDISQRVEQAEQARRRERQLRQMLDHIPTPLAVVSAGEDGRLVYLNRSFEAQFGYTLDDIPTLEDWARQAYPDERYRTRVMQWWADAVARARQHAGEEQGRVEAREVQLRRRDGQPRDVVISSGLVDDLLLATLMDITDRKRETQQRLQAEQRFRIMADHALDNLWTMTPDHRFSYVSPSIERLSGYRPEEFLALGLEALLPAPSLSRAQAYLATLASELAAHRPPPAYRDELQLRRKDGQCVWTEVTASARLDDTGQLVELVGITRDISERKRLDAELQAHRQHLEQLVQARTVELSLAKEAAEAGSRAKSEFLANVGHELRTPMNAILGFGELALRHATDAAQRDSLERVLKASQQLRDLINDILDMARLEAERIALERAPLSIGAVLDGLAALMGPLAREKGLSLEIRLDPALAHMTLLGDERRLAQVLVNLVSNAIKFTSAGSVTVRVTQAGGRDSEASVRFEVIDTGIGIAPQDQARIFLAFVQLDASNARRHAGTGLGLPLSRRLAEAMGGRLAVQSQPGQGSTFIFTVPMERAPAAAGDALPGAPDTGPAGGETAAAPAAAKPDAIPLSLPTRQWLRGLIEQLEAGEPDARQRLDLAPPELAQHRPQTLAHLRAQLEVFDFDAGLVTARAMLATPVANL